MLPNAALQPDFLVSIWTLTSVWASLLLLVLPQWHNKHAYQNLSYSLLPACNLLLNAIATVSWFGDFNRCVAWIAIATGTVSAICTLGMQWYATRQLIRATIPSNDGTYLEEAALAQNLAQIQLNQRIREDWHRTKRDHLRAQMNPHFLFNVLTGIQHVIIAGELDRASELFSKFRKLIVHGFLANGRPLDSLKQEVEHLESYLELESMRMKQAIAFKINASSECQIEDISFPPFMLQPLVENAIWHGLKGGEIEHARIEVMFRWEEDDLVVEVRDNGIGLTTKPGHKHQSRGTEILRSRLNLLTNGGTLTIRNVASSEGKVVGAISTIRLNNWRRVALNN